MRLNKEAFRELKLLLGDRLLTRKEDLFPYSFDASSLFFSPDGVALPERKEEVIEILRIADYYEFPIVARGCGTATTGSPLPITGGLVVSFTRMNKILELNLEERTVRVEPGVINGELKAYLKRYGLFYPPDPASYAFSSIGGNVATGAGGPRGLKYGTTKDYVLSLEVALPGGKVLKTGPQTLKGVVPYNLTPLFVGSEGTLGLFLEILLKVIPLPEKRRLYLIFFPEEVLAFHFLTEILKMGLTPASAEFVDKTTLQALREKLEPYKDKAPFSSLLFIEFDGSFEEVLKDSQRFERILKERKYPFILADEEEEIERLWEIRRAISPLLKKLGAKKIADDITLPRRALSEFLKFLRDLEKASGISISAFGHAGDGNLHVNLLFEEEKKDIVRSLREQIFKKVLELCGTISGEHGVGYLKRPFVIWELDPLQIEIMKKLKSLFDPKGILNPQIKLPD
ncbi:MAG: FAD-binding oxidoreductase [Caldimicrobium thiodismutans]